MEIIENDKPGRNRTVEIIRPRNLFIGIILILAGILWLLNNFGLLSDSAFELIFSWHMLVVLIGTYLLGVWWLLDSLFPDWKVFQGTPGAVLKVLTFIVLVVLAIVFFILNRRNRN